MEGGALPHEGRQAPYNRFIAPSNIPYITGPEVYLGVTTYL